MRTDEIVVILLGVSSIVFVWWYFLGKKRKEVRVSESVDIIVDGGYSPEVISIPAGKTTQFNFLRRDPTNCLEELVIPDFRIKRGLPLNEKVTVEITPKKSGEYTYHCGMNMYKGKIIVKG